MVESGFKTLVDAFAVVQNEHLFNVFNSKDNVVEEFNETNARYYSQSQCAIALERVFSRIYKYLQFKSTTSETFQRHINIDNGYKYLTIDTLKKSDHGLDIYYDLEKDSQENVEKHYLRYLKKLKEYVNSTSADSGIGLTPAEKAILKEFCDILSKQTLDWIKYGLKWDLCPLLQRMVEKVDELSPRKLMARSLTRDSGGSAGGHDDYSSSNPYSDDSSETTEEYKAYDLFINFDKNGFMDASWKARGNVSVPGELTHDWVSDNQLHIKLDGNTDGIDLSKVIINGAKPTYTYTYRESGTNKTIPIDYNIAGYTLMPKSQSLKFTANHVVTSVDFAEESILYVYAAWSSDYILEFSSDNSHYREGDPVGYMAPRKLSSENNKAPMCGFTSPGESRKKNLYFNSPSSAAHKWQSVDAYNTEANNPKISLYGFKEWECTIGAIRYVLRQNDPLKISTFNLDCPPVIRMTAYWERAYDVISFTIDENKYCEVCIDVTVNRVVYPNHAPIIQPETGTWKFYGWDCSEGDYLPGVDRNSTVICGTASNPLVCGQEDGYIVCKEDDIDYTVPIKAYLVEHKVKKFNVTFKYMDESGNHAEHYEEVA